MIKSKLLRKLKKDIESTSINAVSKKIGIPYPTIWRLYRGKFAGRMATWDKIDNYYSGAAP